MNVKKIKKLCVFGKSNTDNVIIEGDNQVVLPLILKKYQGQIKCIYLDPPYNNKETYHHYDDNKAHELWLDYMTSNLKLLNDFLAEDGSIWISIDDNEMHYLKVAADKIFGRANFITTIIWQQRTTRENRKVFSNNHEYILLYAKNPDRFKKSLNKLPVTVQINERYKNPDNDPRGLWQSVSANVQAGHATPNQFYTIVSPSGKSHYPPNGRCWVYNEKKMIEEIKKNNIWFGLRGDGVPRIKKFLVTDNGLVPETLWMGDEVGTNKMAKKHFLRLFPHKNVFDTPKPEQLIQRILKISTNKNDYVLDCFLGSGTTAAVSHKLKRKYVGIEISPSVNKIILERLQNVIEGESGGISSEISWKGGGGFQYYKLIDD